MRNLADLYFNEFHYLFGEALAAVYYLADKSSKSILTPFRLSRRCNRVYIAGSDSSELTLDFMDQIFRRDSEVRVYLSPGAATAELLSTKRFRKHLRDHYVVTGRPARPDRHDLSIHLIRSSNSSVLFSWNSFATVFKSWIYQNRLTVAEKSLPVQTSSLPGYFIYIFCAWVLSFLESHVTEFETSAIKKALVSQKLRSTPEGSPRQRLLQFPHQIELEPETGNVIKTGLFSDTRASPGTYSEPIRADGETRLANLKKMGLSRIEDAYTYRALELTSHTWSPDTTLQHIGYETDQIDISQFSKEKAGLQSQRRYHLILMGDMLRWQRDDVCFLKALNKLMYTAGLIYIETPLISAKSIMERQPSWYRNSGTYREYTRTGLLETFHRAGYRILRSKRCSTDGLAAPLHCFLFAPNIRGKSCLEREAAARYHPSIKYSYNFPNLFSDLTALSKAS